MSVSPPPRSSRNSVLHNFHTVHLHTCVDALASAPLGKRAHSTRFSRGKYCIVCNVSAGVHSPGGNVRTGARLAHLLFFFARASAPVGKRTRSTMFCRGHHIVCTIEMRCGGTGCICVCCVRSQLLFEGVATRLHLASSWSFWGFHWQTQSTSVSR